MNTNQPLAELFGSPQVSERMPVMVLDHGEPISTEWCSERLGTEMIALCEFGALIAASEVGKRDFRAMRDRIALAAIRERPKCDRVRIAGDEVVEVVMEREVRS